MRMIVIGVSALVAVLVLLASVGAMKLFWDFPASKSSVREFNSRVGCDISERTIFHRWDGFVDITGYAAVPMTETEFNELVDDKEMIIQNVADDRRYAGKPYWYKKPHKKVYVLDRLNEREYHDYLACHYDHNSATGYFYYFDI